MDRKYEVMFILRPDTSEEDVDRLLQTMETNVAATGGKVTGFERMGKRRLAYTVKKFQDGIYILAFVEGPGSVLKELERRLRVQELVIKFITVRTDEEEKRLVKVKKLREAKVKGQGAQGQAAAAVAAQAAENATACCSPGSPGIRKRGGSGGAGSGARGHFRRSPVEVPPATV